MRWLLAILLLSFTLGPFKLGSAESPAWWVTNPMTKVRPYDQPPQAPQIGADLHAARNEFEPFQLVLHGGDLELTELDVDLADLLGPGSAVISRDNITIYLEKDVDLAKPSLSGGPTQVHGPTPSYPASIATRTRSATRFLSILRADAIRCFGSKSMCRPRRVAAAMPAQ